MFEGIADQTVIVSTIFLISETRRATAASLVGGLLLLFRLTFEFVILYLKAVNLVAQSFQTAL